MLGGESQRGSQESAQQRIVVSRKRLNAWCRVPVSGEKDVGKCSVESHGEQEEVGKMLMYSCEKRDNLYKSPGCDVEQPKLCKGCFRKLGCLKTIYMCFGVLLPLSPKIEHMVSLSQESLKFWQPLVDATFANPILTNKAQPILTFGALISIVNSTQTHSHIKAFSSPTSPFTSPDIKWTSNLDKQLTPALLEIPHNLATSSALTSLNSPSLLVHVMMLLYWLLINSSNKNCHNLANVLVVLSSTAEDGEIKFYSVDAFILTSWSVVGWEHHQITNSAEFPANIYIFANLDGRFRFATHVQQTNERTHARLF
uniref:Uncharacterized protein n=1 Tax=Timema poppense TaxID=170557 RepID=A0A7R9H2C5_TIMPO|nr:unnamed protein product [Timema poppensis]